MTRKREGTAKESTMFQGTLKSIGVVLMGTIAWLSCPAALADEGAPPQSQPQQQGSGFFGGLLNQPGQGAAPAQPEAEPIPAGQSVSVGSFGQIDLHVKDIELSRVLQLLSIQSQRNIIASRNVGGMISADLYSVDFYEALDAILHPNGLAYREKGNFIYVYTASELKALEESERKMTRRVVRLNYISAADASAFVTPLLSSSGSISVSAETPAGFIPTASDGGGNSFADSDTLVIHDYPENVAEIVSALAELDVRPKQVLIEATVLEARLNEDNALGVDISLVIDHSMSSYINPLNATDTLQTGKWDIIDPATGDAIREDVGPVAAVGQGATGQTTVGNTVSGESGVKLGFVSDHVNAFLRALDRVTDTTVVANPKLLVLNRQRAELLVGGRLGYISTTQTESAATQTVEFLEVGTQLAVRPFVSDDGFIRLELNPEVSDGDTRAVQGLVIPNETTQRLTTNVLVRSGQTVVLGGLFKEDTTIERNQVPFMGDIPLLGGGFKGRDDNVERSEVIFLITPTVMKDSQLYAAGERAKDDIELARIGAREGLLPWSRTKLTAGHLRDAIRHRQEGDDDKALWSVNLALYLDPINFEAQRLKEEITGERTPWQHRSMLKDSLHDIFEQQLSKPYPADSARGQAQRTQRPGATPGQHPEGDHPAASGQPVDSHTSVTSPQDQEQGAQQGQTAHQSASAEPAPGPNDPHSPRASRGSEPQPIVMESRFDEIVVEEQPSEIETSPTAEPTSDNQPSGQPEPVQSVTDEPQPGSTEPPAFEESPVEPAEPAGQVNDQPQAFSTTPEAIPSSGQQAQPQSTGGSTSGHWNRRVARARGRGVQPESSEAPAAPATEPIAPAVETHAAAPEPQDDEPGSGVGQQRVTPIVDVLQAIDQWQQPDPQGEQETSGGPTTPEGSATSGGSGGPGGEGGEPTE